MDRRDIIGDFERYCEFILPQVLRKKIRPYQRKIMRAIDNAINGRGPKRIIITMPPRHWKTLIGRDCFMTYMFGRFPDKVGVYATYNEDFAEGGKDEVAKILASEEYKWLFPNARTRSTTEDIEDIDRAIRKTKKDTSKRISSVNSRGWLTFVGRGNGLTGIPGNYMVADDLYKDKQEAISEKVNQSIWEWFTGVFQNRREPGCIELVFYTRWISNDVIGQLEKYNKENTDSNYEKYLILRYPAERDEFLDGEAEYDARLPGEPLDPQRVGEYARAKKDSDMWMAMYQQMPLDVKGLLFEIGWFAIDSVPIRAKHVVISVDANYTKDSETTDRTAIEVWARINNRYHLIMFINQKMNYPELKEAMFKLTEMFPEYWAVVIEIAANGGPLYDEMRKVLPRIIGVMPHGKTKRERAQYILPLVQSGMVSIPSYSIYPQIVEFTSEVTRFTGTQDREKDDLVDAMVLALTYFEQFGCFIDSTLVDAVPRASVSYASYANSQERGKWRQNVVEVGNFHPQPAQQRRIN